MKKERTQNPIVYLLLGFFLVAFTHLGCSDKPSEITQAKQSLTMGEANALLVPRSSWGSGYCMEVRVENLGAPSSWWELQMDLRGATVQNAWNVDLSGLRGTVTATPVAHNQALGRGEQATFGFCAVRGSGQLEPLLRTLELVRREGGDDPGSGDGHEPEPAPAPGTTPEPGAQAPAEAICTGGVCCPASCGQCGGSGCGALPGGAEQCCTGRIKSAGVDCAGDPDANAPCTNSAPPGAVCAAERRQGRLVRDEETPLVSVDPQCGELSYGQYSNHDQPNRDHILPDFSYAGYRKGGVAIPDVPTVRTLGPRAGDNRERIQAAIDEVSVLPPDANGFRGAVQLRAGTYRVSDTLVISTGGVVLRGAGQGENGTRLIATARKQHDLIQLLGSGKDLGEVKGSRVAITSALVPVGSRSLQVENAGGFSVGDVIGVLRTPNNRWIRDLGTADYGWTANKYQIAHERTVTGVNGRTITVDIPFVDTIEEKYGGGDVFVADLSSRIENSGVEDLRLESRFQSDADEEHGWNAITFSRVANSWVRRVTAVHFGYSVVNLTNQSSFNTIEDTAQLDPVSIVRGGRRYSFNIHSGTGNLFQRCFARNGRHNFVTGARVAGPNVWLDCLSTNNNADEGPHHRWATGLLFDSAASKFFNVQNRGESGSGHGWAGAQTLFWNVWAFSEVRSDAPTGAMNWVVGGSGTATEGRNNEDFGTWESFGEQVRPRSLYLAQLEDRLGAAAVRATTIPEQRDGEIWDLLNGWAGEGRLQDASPRKTVVCSGIEAAASGVCCPASCGQCGGSGCSSAPGGAANCCTGRIEEENLSCQTHAPPCVLR